MEVLSPQMRAPRWLPDPQGRVLFTGHAWAPGAPLPAGLVLLLTVRKHGAVLRGSRGAGQDVRGLWGAHPWAGREDTNLSFLLMSQKVSFQKGCDTPCVSISFPYMICKVTATVF